MSVKENRVEPADLDLLEDFEDEEDLYYFYDDPNHWWELREERGDVPDARHNDLIDYLLQLLRWYYRFENYTIHREINFYQTDNPDEKPLYPDLFVLKSQQKLVPKSYRLGVDGPPPQVVFEIMSEKTRRVDLYQKPKRYQAWGTAEYFVYDPRPRQRRTKTPRLWGWRLNRQGQYDELKLDEQGRMWSGELNCWLVPQGETLRLYDKDGQPLLTEAEALRRQNAELMAKLRQLGYDPDRL